MVLCKVEKSAVLSEHHGGCLLLHVFLLLTLNKKKHVMFRIQSNLKIKDSDRPVNF